MTTEDNFRNYRQQYPDGERSDFTWSARLDKIVRTVPEHIAFIQGERRLTWREFGRAVNRLASGLLELGIGKEDRVAIMGFNSIEWMISYFGISKIGAVPVNVNPRFIAPEIRHILEDSDTAGVIVEAESIERLAEVRASLPRLKHAIAVGDRVPAEMISFSQLLERSAESSPVLPWKVTNSDFAFLFYTGGTTGYPKGTVWDYFNRVRGLDAILITSLTPMFHRIPELPSEAFPALLSTLPLPVSEKFLKGRLNRWLLNHVAGTPFSERLLLALFGSRLNYRLSAGKIRILEVAPLFHGTGYETNFATIGATAATSIYLTKSHPFDPAELWETVGREKVNIITIVGDAFAIPMAEELERKNYDTRSLAVIISSGVRWSPGVKKRLLKKMPALVLLDELGSTETSAAFSQISAADGQEIAQLKVKLVKEGINVSRVINPLTGEEVRPGERGELIFGGFNALGYWKDPERTARHFRTIEGRRWFFVGDQGTVDEEGYFHFEGRGSSIINTGGEKVYAEEVEEILMTHPKIRDVGVTGVPDPRWGEAVTALVETAPEADLVPQEIIAYCRERMAGYKKPKHILFVPRLPRTSIGKLQRKELKEMALKMIKAPEQE